MEKFNIPVVLFIFKRYKTTKKIIDILRQINVSHIYLIADGARDEQEEKRVSECRSEVEKYIDWDCTVTKNYADKNRGVMENIGNGARWVLKEKKRRFFWRTIIFRKFLSFGTVGKCSKNTEKMNVFYG